MTPDPDDILARARAAQAGSARLWGVVYEMKVQTMLAATEHELIENTPWLAARLRSLLLDGEAVPKH
ncbi:hypothetical protein ACFPK1_13575 [Actinomycetospora rhizophila]|uniref:Uncharacterized protein n=1 Tax=Actinomycetospora rhizophila TaxID=1416876 RepID=A0ABV9ZFU8_9PSEU